MSPFLRTLCLAAALTATAAPAAAIEYRSVSEPAILFDTPSDQGKRLFIVAPGTPVEVVVVLDRWVKVRDSGGAITWIQSTALAPKRTVMVTAERAVVRAAPEAEAAPLFETVRDAVLELAGQPARGWVQVRHQDGTTGFLRVSEVWGL